MKAYKTEIYPNAMIIKHLEDGELTHINVITTEEQEICHKRIEDRNN